MAIDWGIALGSAVGSGVDTYKKMQQQALEDLKARKLQQEFDEENAFQESVKKQAAIKAPTGGAAAGEMIDKGIQYESPEIQAAFKNQLANLTPEQQQAALRTLKGSSVDVRQQASAVPAEGTPQTKPVVEPGAKQPEAGLDLSKINVYKGEKGETLASTETGGDRGHEKVMRSVMQDMQASGNMAGYQKAAGIYKLAREVSMSDAVDKIMEETNAFENQFKTSLKENGMIGTVDKFSDEFAKNGIKLSVVKGANGQQAVAVLGPDGKPQHTFTSPAQMSAAFDNLMRDHTFDRLMKVPGHNPKDLMSMYKDKAQGTYYDKKSFLDEQMAPFQIAHLQAQTDASRASAEASRNSVNNLGTPVGTLEDGTPVYKGGVTGDGKKLDPKTEIFPWSTSGRYATTSVDKNVTITDPETGKQTSMPVTIVSKTYRNGDVTREIKDMDGNVIKDKSIISQIHKGDLPKPRTVDDVRKEWSSVVKSENYIFAKTNEKQQIKDDFFKENGMAPDWQQQAILTGKNPKGQPLTLEDYERHNRTYWLTPVPIPEHLKRSSAIPNTPGPKK